MRRTLSLVLLFFFVLPCIMSSFSACAGWRSMDFESYEYFAMTDEDGKEYVYAGGEREFREAAHAFKHAEKAEAPAWLSLAPPPLLVEWIEKGHALQYHLYLYPRGFAAYLQDAEGNGAALTKEDALFFLSAEASRPSLRGEEPPAVLLGMQEIAPSICSWRYMGGLDGTAVSLSSGDYLNTSATSYPVDLEKFVLSYEKEPTRIQHTLYRGEEEVGVFSDAELSKLSLSAGEYQLVSVLEWEQDRCCIRAGYSFAVSIP